MLPFVVIVLLFLYIRNEKINTQLLLKYIVLGSLIVVILYAFRIYRFYGSLWFVDKFKYDEFIRNVEKLFKTNNGELGLIDAFYYFINNNNFPGFWH